MRYTAIAVSAQKRSASVLSIPAKRDRQENLVVSMRKASESHAFVL